MCVCPFVEKKENTSFPYPEKNQAKVNQVKGREISARHRNNKIKHLLTIMIMRYYPWKSEVVTCSTNVFNITESQMNFRTTD